MTAMQYTEKFKATPHAESLFMVRTLTTSIQSVVTETMMLHLTNFRVQGYYA